MSKPTKPLPGTVCFSVTVILILFVPVMLQALDTMLVTVSSSVSGYGSVQVVEAVRGDLLLKLEDPDRIEEVLESSPFEIVRRFPRLDFFTVRLVNCTAYDAATASKVCEDWIGRFRSLPGVKICEPNVLHKTSRTPNDPLYAGNQYSLNNTGQTGGTPGADIDAERAWDISTGESIVVAVIDNGLDIDHPDIVGNLWQNPGEIVDGLDNDNNGYVDDINGYDFFNNDSNPQDIDGHGSHVSGIIAAVGNNGTGITGVNWTARVMALKTGDFSSLSSDAIMAALVYARDMGARVVNMSFGSTFASESEHDAIKYAAAGGLVLVAAAGNNNSSNQEFPAAFDEVVAVASTDNNDAKSSFSNFGSWIEVAAPDTSIESFSAAGGYQFLSGTSMASPHVAGAAALALAVSPSLTGDDVRTLLKTTAEDLGNAGFDNTYGYGRINAAYALGNFEGQRVAGFQVAVPDPVNANVPFSVAITALDTAGAPVASFTRVEYSLSSGTVSKSISAEFQNGTLQETITVNGYSQSVFTVSNGLFSGTVPVEISLTETPAVRFELSAPTEPVSPGSPLSVRVRAVTVAGTQDTAFSSGNLVLAGNEGSDSVSGPGGFVDGETLVSLSLIRTGNLVLTATAGSLSGTAALRVGEFDEVASFPYVTSFESDSPGWIVGGSSLTWERGTPSNGPSQAFEGNSLFGTDLDANYPDLSYSYLVSPTFYLPDSPDLFLRFYHYVDVEDPTDQFWDGGVLEVSTDSGVTWDELGDTRFDVKYDGRISLIAGSFLKGRYAYSKDSIETTSVTWKMVRVNLDDFRDSPVKFRFLFASDQASNAPGWYIDSLEVGEDHAFQVFDGFAASFGTRAGDPGFDATFDVSGAGGVPDGVIDFNDVVELGRRWPNIP